MKKFFHLLALFCITISLPAQKNGIRKVILIADITDTSLNKTKAYIHSITDTGMFIMDQKKPVYSDVERSRLYKIDPEMIQTVKMRKPKQVAKGLGLGMLAGMAAGAVIGLASYRDPGPEAWFDFGPGVDALAGAGIGMIVGGVTGIIISVPSRKFRINGDHRNFKKMQVQFYNRISQK